MDNDTLREMMTDTNFFHHNPHFYLGGSLANPSAVVRDGMNFLSRCKALEPVLYERRYKGTPFYWIGCAAFLSHDYETAAFLFDASASEDMREERDGLHSPGRMTPALRFLRAEGEKPDQAAQALTQHLQCQLQKAVDDYNSRLDASDRLLTLADIQTAFLQHSLAAQQDTTLLTAFISYFLEWHHRSELAALGIKATSAEPFVLHHFKGCVLFESLLRTRVSNPAHDTLGHFLQCLAKELGILPDRSKRMARLDIPDDVDLPTLVALAPTTDRSIETAITITDLTRNKLGHRLDWKICFESATFDALAGCISTSLLHAIASLYR
jgi:hypothetical protein